MAAANGASPSALRVAAGMGHVNIVDRLGRAPFWLGERDAQDAFEAAVRGGSVAVLERLLAPHGKNVESSKEVLRRQGLLEGIWCLDPDEGLSPGQAAELSRVHDAYPALNDDEFVARHLQRWLLD